MCHAATLLPALLGALLGWPAVDTFLLLTLGLVAHIWLSRRSARRLYLTMGDMPSTGTMALAGGGAGLLGYLAAVLPPAHLAPLVLVVILIVAVDPIWRLILKRLRSVS